MSEQELKLDTTQPEPDYILHCDGGCTGNGTSKAVGAWSYIIEAISQSPTFRVWESRSFFELNGKPPTNNKAEFLAAIHGLKRVGTNASVRVVTDSMVLVNWINRINRGKPRKKSDMDPLLISDLTHEVLKRKVSVQWVKGHDGNKDNEWCDYECKRLLTLDS